MARVYRGIDRVLGRTVAIKVLSSDLGTNPQFITRFQREAQSAASVSHPNLVSIFDTGSEDGVHYIVMEYVEGRTLEEALIDGPISPDAALEIAAAVCSGLSVAHQKGIVHRDIKPANIMLERNGRVKLMDFGIAKAVTSPNLTETGLVLGTVVYLSPEQANGLPVDARSDIYSLGCVLYEMLTGRPPISGQTLLEVARKLSTEQPAPPSELNPSVSRRMDSVVMKALAKSPSQRYQTAAEMKLDLEGGGTSLMPARDSPREVHAGDNEATTAVHRGVSPTRVLRRPAGGKGPRERIRRTFWALTGGAALVTLIAVLVAAMLGPQERSPQPTTGPPATLQPPSLSAPTPDIVDPGKRRVPLNEAVQSVVDLVESGLRNGQISPRGAENVLEEVDKGIEEYREGDPDDAQEAIEEARGEVRKYLERQEVTVQFANALFVALGGLEELLGG
jgi:serine/threonine-protein kinase